MNGAKTKGTLNLGNAEIIPDKNSVAQFSVEVGGSDYQKEISVLLLPTDASEEIEFTITLGNSKTYLWKVPHKLESGKAYSYNIKLDKNVLDIQPAPGYLEIPKYKSGAQAPNSVEALHMVGSTGWLNPSFTYEESAIRNYSVLFDKVNRLPYWIAFPMHPMYLKSGNRTDAWEYDPIIPQEFQPVLYSSWTQRDMDRGHMMASADRSASPEINRTTFYFTNMVPQNQTMNSGNWADLETKVRSWTTEVAYDTLYVVTGSILPESPEPITYATDTEGNESAIPKYLYKALLKKELVSGEYTSIAFKMENTDNRIPYSESVISVAQLEVETGFEFFPNLPEDVAAEIKSNTNLSLHWK